jgi:hypothetical protein
VSAGAGASAAARPARRSRLLPLTALGLWVAVALALQRWWSWGDAIRARFAADTSSYERIARAAPSFPREHVLRPFAERFPAHWLVGSLADGLGLSLHGLYRFFDLLVLALMLAAVHLALRRLGLGAHAYALAMGAVAASAYPVHYLLAAPGMLSDGVFVLGLSAMLLGFVSGRFELALGGLVLGTLGRQSAVPVALAAALWVLAAPAWRRRRVVYAATILLVPLGLWLALHFAVGSFADPQPGPFRDLTVLGYDPRGFADHLGRIALGILVPSALVAGAWARTRGRLPRGALLAAGAVVAQTLVLGPTSNSHNEPRLAGLAVPALAVAAGALLRRARLTRAELGVLGLAVLAGGLHPRYTHAGLGRTWQWVVLEAVSAALVVAVLARPAVRPAPRPVSPGRGR